MKLNDSILAQAPVLTAIRRDLHAHPELGYEENRTSDLVACQLTAWGIEVHRGLGGTGAAGVVPGIGKNRGRGHNDHQVPRHGRCEQAAVTETWRNR